MKSFSHNPERLSLSVHRLNRDRVSWYELAGAMTDKARLCTRSMSLQTKEIACVKEVSIFGSLLS